MFFRDNIQYDRDYKELIASCNESYNIYKKVQSKVYGEVDEKMAKPLDKFSSSPEYVALCYTKSTLMFNSLEETLGEKKFEKALLSLYEKYKFQEVSREEFIALMSSSTHRNLEGFFNSWLDGSVVIV